MRYLKPYNLFESKAFIGESPMKSVIKDIFLELEEEHGFGTSIRMHEEKTTNYSPAKLRPGMSYSQSSQTFCIVQIFKEERFEYSDISEYIERLKDYMADNNFYCYDFTSYFGQGGEKQPKIQPELNRQFNRFGDEGWTDRAYSFEIFFNSLDEDKTNEELKSDTYKQAGAKLKNMGHIRRGTELLTYAEEIKLREEKAKHQQKFDNLKKWGIFDLSINRGKWDSTKKMTTFNEPRISGKFLIECVFDGSWFSDMVHNWLDEDKKYNLSFPIEVSLMPYDDETLIKFKEVEQEFSRETYDGLLSSSRIWITIIKGGEVGISSNGPVFWEAIESDYVFFNSRSEAMKFKSLLVSAISGQNDYCSDRYSKGLHNDIIKFIEMEDKVQQEIEEGKEREECSSKWKYDRIIEHGPLITMEDFPKIVSSVKSFSLNQLYKD
jgi:hypothetical protein